MEISTQWIVATIEIVLICTAVAVVLVVLRDNRRGQNVVEESSGGAWFLELWHIRCGYRVNLMFANTAVLGRSSIYSHIVGTTSPELDATISREHCMLYEQNGAVWVWNLSTVNPTLLNGHRLNTPVQLLPGDRLGLGDSTFLVTRVERRD